ncbi:MAG: ABC transporter permease, partial [Cytophagales bacterium]|nr:ABC transporter permease [Cytophagales bacterium]
MKFLIQVYESLIFAYQALRSNIMRTTLSLLGVSVGIFAIVAVFTAVDSLNKNIRSEIDSFAGSGVLYVGKWPWIMQNNYPWWKYLNRPEMKYSEFQFLKDNLKSAKAIAIIDNGRSASATKGSSSMDVNMTGASYDYNQITSVPVQFGRYFLPIESENALNVVIIGAKVSENLQA